MWLLALASLAYADGFGCDEIVQLEDLRVPDESILGVIDEIGRNWTEADVACLRENDVSPRIIDDVARRVEPVDAPDPRPVTPVVAPQDPDDDAPQAILDLERRARAGKHLTAIAGYVALLDDQSFPEHTTRLQFDLGQSLVALGLPRAAQRPLLEATRKGPKDPTFDAAVTELVQIARATGDDSELMRLAGKVPLSGLPRGARAKMAWLAGRKAYEDDRLTDALAWLDEVDDGSVDAARARALEGVIHHRRAELRAAADAWKEGLASPRPDVDADAKARLDDVFELDLARLSYGLGRFDTAADHYERVTRLGPAWGDSLRERAWTSLQQNDPNTTLGLLLTLRAPQLKDSWQPEAPMLRAVTYYTLCHDDDVTRVLDGFEATYAPMNAELKEVLAEGDGEAALDRWFSGEDLRVTALPRSFFLDVLRDDAFSDALAALDAYEAERAKIAAQPADWRAGPGTFVLAGLADDEARVRRRAGALLLAHVQRTQAELADLLQQSKILRFETVDLQRRALEDPNPVHAPPSGPELNLPADPVWESWPFNGEFWDDELGYYRYAEVSRCR